MTETPLVTATPAKRASLWLMASAMVFIIGLKSYSGFGSVPWHFLGWPLMAASLFIAWRKEREGTWWKTTVILAYLVVVLFFTRIDGDTGDAHVLELVLWLGIGILLIPALLAKYWIGQALDYSWFRASGR